MIGGGGRSKKWDVVRRVLKKVTEAELYRNQLAVIIGGGGKKFLWSGEREVLVQGNSRCNVI